MTASDIYRFYLKGHGNESDFPRFVHKSVWHMSLSLHFELFHFWLQIRGEKRLPDSAYRGVADSPTRRVGELSILRLGESGSR